MPCTSLSVLIGRYFLSLNNDNSVKPLTQEAKLIKHGSEVKSGDVDCNSRCVFLCSFIGVDVISDYLN